MGTGVGEAMLIGAAVGATAGGAGAAIQGGDPLQGALMGGATGAIGGGIAGYAGAAPAALEGGATGAATGAGTGAATGAGTGAATFMPSSTGLMALPGEAGIATLPSVSGVGAGVSAPFVPSSTGLAVLPGEAGTSAAINPQTAALKPNIFGYMPGEKGFISNPALATIGGTSALGGMMQAERGQFGIPGGLGDYDGPLSKLKYDPDKFIASEPTYAPGSVYAPQYRTYAAEGGIMRLARGGNVDAESGFDEPMYMAAGGGTPTTLAPQGLEQLMGVKGKGQSLEEMKESAALQGLTPRAYLDIYGEGIKAQQQMAKGGMSSLGGYSDGGRMLKGPGDGMSDSIPGVIGGRQPARLADGEFVVPADVVSHLGNGSTDAGAKQLYSMMDKVRKARTGKKAQGKQINPRKYMPA